MSGRSRKPKAAEPAPDCRAVFRLAEHYSHASDLLKEQSKGDGWAFAPRLLVDSFAVELYLKCLFILDTNAAPDHEHDWKILFDQLLPHTKTAIRETFDRVVSSDPILPLLHLVNPDAVKVLDFDRSLAAAKGTFDKKRYLFDPPTNDEFFYADLLRAAIRSITKMDVRLAGL